MRSTFLLLFVAFIASQVDSKDVTCTFVDIKYEFFSKNLRSCLIQNQAITDASDSISSPVDNTVESFTIRNANQLNKVEFIPEKIAEKFPQAIAIGIYECAVKFICENNFKNLRKLKYLNLGDNAIKTIEKNSFKDLGDLELLSLSKNQIEFLSEKVFAPLVKLKHLFLGQNQIEVLNPKMFDTLANLEAIQLSDNKLQFLHPKTFEKLVNLKNISMSRNALEEIGAKTFGNNRKLEWLFLGTNKLKSIEPTVFNDLSVLKYIELRNNTCINEFYHKQHFEVMKADVRQNCVTFTVGELKGMIGNYQEKLISVVASCNTAESSGCEKPKAVVVDNTPNLKLAACEAQAANETAQVNALKLQVDNLNNKIRLLTKGFK